MKKYSTCHRTVKPYFRWLLMLQSIFLLKKEMNCRKNL